jgi:hypothetical protein
MFNFDYKYSVQGDILIFKATGFTTYEKAVELINSIIGEIKAMDKKGRPYKILFDMRGLKALDIRTTEVITQLDKVVYESPVLVKVGTVLDNIIALFQQKRLIGTEYDMGERAMVTSDYDKCVTWLKE